MMTGFRRWFLRQLRNTETQFKHRGKTTVLRRCIFEAG